jgi:excisionase family DNA binding protein
MQPDDCLAYNVTQAARIIGVSRPTLYRLLGEGEIEARKIRNRTVVLRAELERYLNSRPAYEPQGAA